MAVAAAICGVHSKKWNWQGRLNSFVVDVHTTYERYWSAHNLLLSHFAVEAFIVKEFGCIHKTSNNAKGWLSKRYLCLPCRAWDWWMLAIPSCHEGYRATAPGVPLQPSRHLLPLHTSISLPFGGGACAGKYTKIGRDVETNIVCGNVFMLEYLPNNARIECFAESKFLAGCEARNFWCRRFVRQCSSFVNVLCNTQESVAGRNTNTKAHQTQASIYQ